MRNENIFLILKIALGVTCLSLFAGAVMGGVMFSGLAIWGSTYLIGSRLINFVHGTILNQRAKVAFKKGLTLEQLLSSEVEHQNKLKRKLVKGNRWNMNEFPADMSISSKENDVNKILKFECAGNPDFVEGRLIGRTITGRSKMEFTLIVNDGRKAEKIAEHAQKNNILGFRMERRLDGSFALISDNPYDINSIAKEFFPPRTMTVERHETTINQYIITDCRSYEEAVEKFKELKAGKKMEDPANSFSKTQYFVNGIADPNIDQDGEKLTVTQLPVGSYIINDEQVEVHSKNVTFNRNIDETEEALRSVAIEEMGVVDSSDLVQDKGKSNITDGLEGLSVTRYVMDGDEILPLADESQLKTNRKSEIVVRFNSVDSLVNTCLGNQSLQGHTVQLDTSFEDNMIRPGEIVLTLPVDKDTLNCVSLINDRSEEIYPAYEKSGVQLRDIQSALVMKELGAKSYVSVDINDQLDFSKAKINGVPVKDFIERSTELVEKGRSEAFSNREDAFKWLTDAARIETVQMDLDMKNNSVTITSTLRTADGIQTNTITRSNLSFDEMDSLATRPRPSSAELKEVVMQSNPDKFEYYRKTSGKYSVYKDPMLSFIKNSPVVKQKPRKRPAKSASQKKAPRIS